MANLTVHYVTPQDRIVASHTAAAGNRGRPVWAYEPIRCRKARAVARASSTLATT